MNLEIGDIFDVVYAEDHIQTLELRGLVDNHIIVRDVVKDQVLLRDLDWFHMLIGNGQVRPRAEGTETTGKDTGESTRTMWTFSVSETIYKDSLITILTDGQSIIAHRTGGVPLPAVMISSSESINLPLSELFKGTVHRAVMEARALTKSLTGLAIEEWSEQQMDQGVCYLALVAQFALELYHRSIRHLELCPEWATVARARLEKPDVQDDEPHS